MSLSQTVWLVLLVTCSISPSKQAIYNTCEKFTQEVATSQISIDEANTQTDVDINQARYTVDLPFSSVIESVTFSDDTRNTDNSLPPKTYFQLIRNTNLGNWQIRMIKPIDRDGQFPAANDDINSVEYELICKDNANTSPFYPLVKMQIVDLNDNAPQFVGAPYAATVNEFMPVGTTIFRSVSSTDLDRVKNAVVEYTILPGNGDANDGFTKFAIPTPSQGFVAVSETLDFEAVNVNNAPFYIVRIQAADQPDDKTKQKKSVTFLNITITDGDDQGPVFEYSGCRLTTTAPPVCFNPEYSISVVTGSTTGVLEVHAIPDTTNSPVTIAARDQDSLNYPISFTIEQTTPAGLITKFNPLQSVRPAAGSLLYTTSLSLRSAITKADVINNEFEIVIRATETGPTSGANRFQRAIVRGKVVAANNFPPTVTSSTGNFIGYIREDAKTNDHVRDSSLTNTLQLVVTDQDVSASDPKQTYTYEVIGTTAFKVDTDGFLRLAAPGLDYDAGQKTYTFQVRVTEASTKEKLSTTQGLTVNVIDVNDNRPTFQSNLLKFTKPAGTYNKDFITNIQATDADSNPNNVITYTIQSVSNNAASKFILEQNALYLQGTFAEGDSYAITISATDGGTPALKGVVTVILDIVTAGNKSPNIPGELYTVYVSEGIDLNRQIFTTPVIDDDKVLTFSIENVLNTQDTTFNIGQPDGIVRNNRRLDRESIPEYNLTITVRDPEQKFDTTRLRVVITDINDNNPVFAGPGLVGNIYTFTVTEGQSPPVDVGSVQASDSDQPNTPNSQLTYSIVAIDNTPLPFSIQQGVGNAQIKTSQVIDYETKKQYKFFVYATDQATDQRRGSATVIVMVNDVQDNIPLFVKTQYEASVKEGVAGLPVVKVTAEDLDTQKDISYEIVDAAAKEFFTINRFTGQITTAKALDYEKKQNYLFYVTTSGGRNQPGLSASATVTVNVVDINDSPPQIFFQSGQSVITEKETAPIGKLLVDLGATDRDKPGTLNSQITFNLDKNSILPQSGKDLFYINPNDGRLVLSKPFTTDTLPQQYKMNITAEDGGNPKLTAVQSITVNVDRNTAPVFVGSPYTTSMNENVLRSTSVFAVSATDSDTSAPFNQLTYTLDGDIAAMDYFTVNSQNGQISTSSLKTVDRDRFLPMQYLLRIIATDGGGLKATATVTINVNRNLHSPLLQPQNYTAQIYENSPLGENIVKIFATDNDLNKPNNELAYSITSDQISQRYFQIDAQGNIKLYRSPALDRTINRFTMTVDVRDKGLPNPRLADKNPAYVVISVIRNSQSPLFFNSTYSVTLRENTGFPSDIIQVTATDSDQEPRFKTIRYTLIGDGEGPTFFTVAPQTGQVQLVKSLAETKKNTLTLRIVARDTETVGVSSRSATALVIVTVTRNFLKPTWPANPNYYKRIPETFSVQAPVITVKATDNDPQPPNNVVNYKLIADPAVERFFQIGKSDGIIRILRPLSLAADPKPSRYNMKVRAFDGGSPSLTSVVDIDVTIEVFRNNHAPVFTQDVYPTNLKEGSGIGETTQLLSVLATDTDTDTEFNQVSYSIVGPVSAKSLFRISKRADGSGIIQPLNAAAAQTLDKNPEAQYYINLQAADNGNPSLTASSLVIITFNRNVYPPVISPTTYKVTIFEHEKIGKLLQTVRAYDNDTSAPDNQFFFSATGTPAAQTYFDVSRDGVVTTIQDLRLDTSLTTQYTLYVKAEDMGKRPFTSSNTATVTITVVRNMHTPQFQNIPYDRLILRTAGPTSEIVTVSASDADTQNPYNVVSYEIITQSLPRFTINSNTGQIKLTQGISTDSVSEYVITVQAKDGGSPPKSAYTTFRVTVDRNLARPVLVTPAAPRHTDTRTILETAGFADAIYKVIATDADLSNPYNLPRYTVVGNGTAPTYFQIDSITGDIRLKASLLRDSLKSYTVVVRIEDQGTPAKTATASATVNINVIRNDHSPYWIGDPYSKIIDETHSLTSTILTVQARDNDPVNTFEKITYSVLDDGSASRFFTVDNNGNIRLTQSLSKATDARFFLRVQASDNGVPPKTNTTVVTITINRNLGPPSFNSTFYQTTIKETQALGVSIIRVFATDPDSTPPHNTPVFSLDTNFGDYQWFFIDKATGVISVRKWLVDDPNKKAVYELHVKVKDMGIPSISGNSATVRINVVRNRGGPSCNGSPYTTIIKENRSVGTGIGIRILCTDPDQNNDPFGNLTMTLIGDNKATDYFEVAKDGTVSLKNDLTTDNGESYTLRVRVSDGGQPSKSTTALVFITVNRNLNPPVIAPLSYSARIPETQAFGTRILTVQASDNDRLTKYKIIHFRISNDAFSRLGREYFMISDNGVLSVLKNLKEDPAHNTVYNFSVQAYDDYGLVSNPAAVVSVVVYRNTNPPRFDEKAVYQVEILNNHTINTVIFDANATDLDTDSPFKDLTYSIIGDGDSLIYFTINPSTGVVSLTRTVFGANIPSEFKVRLFVQDGGTPKKDDTKVLTVKVKRNLHDPKFYNLKYSKTILETLPVGQSVIDVYATDDDTLSPYNEVTYYMDVTNNAFLIEPKSGIIRVRNSLIGGTENTVKFNVIAQDAGNPRRKSTPAPVTITIQRNQFPPVFQNEPYRATIRADIGTGQIVKTISATDNDTVDPFNRIEFNILPFGNILNLFAMNGRSIVTASGFSSDGGENYQIFVQAKDGGTPPKIDLAVVNVIVTRNLYAPQFQVTTVTKTILEIQKLGETFLTVTASDNDQSSPNKDVEYSLTPATTNEKCRSFFGITKSGGLYVHTDLVGNQNKETLYNCEVQAQDLGKPSRNSTNTLAVQITVVRNTAPRFVFRNSGQTFYTVIINRTVNNGSFIGTFSVVDSDQDSPFNELQYRVTGAGKAANFFAIQGNNQVVVSDAAGLAADSDTSYILQLYTRDGGRSFLSDETEMRITVKRNLVAPSFTTPFKEVNITELTPAGTLLATMTATDLDPKAPANQFTYSARDDRSPVTEYLYVHTNTGEVKLLKPVKDKTINRLDDFFILAIDKGFPAKTGTGTVRVNVLHDSGRLRWQLSQYFVQIDENKQVKNQVIQVRALPQFQPGSITYKILGYSDAPNWFEIDTEGMVTVKKDLRKDLAKRSEFILQVSATEKFEVNTQVIYTNVTIQVTRNVNSPVFSRQNKRYETTIDEKQELGTVVLQLNASDADGDTLRFQFIKAVQGSFDFFFLRSLTGSIILIKDLTKTTIKTFEFTVEVRDQAVNEKTDSATVIINVVRDNSPPHFINAPYTTTINFNTKPGTTVYNTVQADDADRGTRPMGFEVGSGYLSALAFFSVDPTTGSVVLRSSIAGETADVYTLELRAFDSGSPEIKATTNITINVNKNPTPPAWNQTTYKKTILETQELGPTLITLTSSDADGHKPVYTVSTAQPANCNNYFALLSPSGNIYLKRDLTLSNFGECRMTISLQDTGVPARSSNGVATVTITVTRNVNAPVFSGPCSATVPENITVGSDIATIKATDADPPNTVFARIDYTLIGDGNAISYFRLSGDKLKVTSDLTQDVVDFYSVKIKAADGGKPSKSATATCSITILRNLNPPVFVQNRYNFTVMETHQYSTPVGQVSATDRDRQNNPQSDITYKIVERQNGGNAQNFFTVDKNGRIFIRILLTSDTQKQTQFDFDVVATDKGKPQRSSTINASVTVNVIRNLNAPVFQNEPYSEEVSFQILPGSSVGSVHATDNDTHVSRTLLFFYFCRMFVF